ncbi:hypothetical protein [Salinibacillus aidingensis]
MFTVEESLSIEKTDSQYILFQFNSESSNLKHVYLSDDVQLPRINFLASYNLDLNNSNIAVIGNTVDKNVVPSDYTIIGYFNHPNSYQLIDDVWLISNQESVKLNNGREFIFSTPNPNTNKTLEEAINIDSYTEMKRELFGTYSKRSNQMIIIGLKTAILFMVIIFLVISTNWLMNEKYLIKILFLSGISNYTIYYTI